MRGFADATRWAFLAATLQMWLCLPAEAGRWGQHGNFNHGDWDDRRLTVQDSEDIHRTFHPAKTSQPLEIEVDDVDGSIQVTGHDGDQVELIVHRKNRARSDAKLAAAKQEVRLDITEAEGLLGFNVRYPQNDRNSFDCRSSEYAVRFDFELRVPRQCVVALRTVNDGDITVSGVHGGWDVENVNGNIEMRDMAGSGHVYALNGEVDVSFVRNPTEDSDFGALNGDIDVAFQSDLAAKLVLKSRNGDAYTDFEGTQSAGLDIQHERRGEQHVYSVQRGMATQVGRGGPDLEFDAFNGDIRIRKRDD